MPGPWENYQTQAQPAGDGPWSKYASAAPAARASGAIDTTDPSLLAQLGQSFGNTAANVTKGAGALVDMPIDALNAAVEHFGGPSDYFQTIHGLTDEAARKLGVVPDDSPSGHVVGDIEQAIGGLGTGMGAGQALAKSGNAGAKAIGEALTASPRAQGVGTVTGTGLSSVERERGASPTEQIEASVLGGIAPAAAGAIGQGARIGARALLGAPSPEAVQLAQRAIAEGIPLSAAQISDSRFPRLLDSVSSQAPFSGSDAFRNTQQQAFNRAVGRTIGLDTDRLTAQQFAKAKADIGQQFEQIGAKAQAQMTPQVMNDLRSIIRDAKLTYGQDTQSNLNAIVGRIVNQSQNGVIPGRAFLSLDSMLSRALASGGEKTVPIGQIQEVLRDAANSSIPAQDQDAWQLARRQWRDLKTLEPLVAANPTEGNISAAGLQGKVTSNKAGKAAMASGRRGDLGELAQIGQRFLKSTTPDSGTAQRSAVIGAIRQGGSLLGGLAGGAAVGHPVSALLGGLGMVGGARATQVALRNEALVNGLLGQRPALNPLLLGLGASLDPTYQGLRPVDQR